MQNYIPGPTYSISDTFLREFTREFPEYRIRWSFKKRCWHIEQHCGRNVLPPFRVETTDDRMIRARDGFWLVMEVQPGDRMPCPRCDNTLYVPIMKFGEARCENCIMHGRDGRTACGYMPFTSVMLDHLRRTDPLRGGTQRLAAEADAANQQMLKDAAKRTHDIVEAGTKDAFSRIVGIPSVGYTGKSKNIHLSKDIT